MIMLLTLGALILCVYTSATIFAYDGPDFRVFLSNTFYLTPDSEPNITWTVLSLPVADIQARSAPYTEFLFEHFYECIWISRVYTSCANTTLDSYVSCIKGSSGVSTLLDTCAGVYDVGQSWPSASSYTNCINEGLGGNRMTLNALRTCVNIKPWPKYEVPQEVDSVYFLGSFSWPMLMLTGFFLYLLFGIYTANPMDWEDSTVIEMGKPSGMFSFSRMGMVWIIFSLIGAIAWMLISVFISFRAGTTWPNNNANPFPSTQSTNMIMIAASLVATFYFLLEMSEYFDRKVFVEPIKEAKGETKPEPEEGPIAQASRAAFHLPVSLFSHPSYTQAVQNGMGYYFPDHTRNVTINSIKTTATQYVPVLLCTWSDAYLFDILLFTGAIGATMQIGTAEITNLFWALFYYRVAHMGVSRMVYESYVRAGFEGESVNVLKDKGLPESAKSEEENASLCNKINALAMHFAAICSLVVFYSIITNKYHMLSEYTALQDFCFWGIYMPEILRIIGHIYILLRSNEVEGSKGVYILIFTHFIWMWDMLVRLAFVYCYFYGTNTYIGTKPFLLEKSRVINSTLVSANHIW